MTVVRLAEHVLHRFDAGINLFASAGGKQSINNSRAYRSRLPTMRTRCRLA